MFLSKYCALGDILIVLKDTAVFLRFFNNLTYRIRRKHEAHKAQGIKKVEGNDA